MAEIQDIPKLVKEFYELSRAYLLQETVEPAKRLGHFGAYSLGAALLWALGILLLAVGGLRALYDLLPPGPYWEAGSYLAVAVVLIGIIAVLAKLAPDRGVHDGTPSTASSLATKKQPHTDHRQGANG